MLGAILSLAASAPSLERGLLLMAAYALGLGLPFLLTALFLGRALGLMAGIKRHMRAVEVATGVLLVAVGLTMLTGAFSVLVLVARDLSGPRADRLRRPANAACGVSRNAAFGRGAGALGVKGLRGFVRARKRMESIQKAYRLRAIGTGSLTAPGPSTPDLEAGSA